MKRSYKIQNIYCSHNYSNALKVKKNRAEILCLKNRRKNNIY